MPSTLNLMTTGAVASKYGISVTSVNYAIRSDKVRAFEVDTGSVRKLFLIDPDSADQRWGAGKGKPPTDTPKPSEIACVVRRSEDADSPVETVTLARVSQDPTILDAGGVVLFQDTFTPDIVAVHASRNIGALLLNVSVNAPSVRPLFIQVAKDPASALNKLTELMEPYADSSRGGYSTDGAVRAVYAYGLKQ